jgi:xanthine dehydrogenase accessory factor
MAADLYQEIVALRTAGMRAALATVIGRKGSTPRKESAKMLIHEDGGQTGSIGGGSIEAEVRQEARDAMNTGKSRLLVFDLSDIDHDERALVCGGSMEVYIEPILPDPVLCIFGGGDVSKAVADAAELIGFKIVIVDDRIQYADPKRFPGATVLFAENWKETLESVGVNHSSYIFIATRRSQSDLVCLRFALQSPARYIGMLGSRTKTEKLFDILKKEGIDRTSFDRVFVPAGFDIDSETPEEIAASIAAELVAARRNLRVRILRDAVREANRQEKAGDRR